MLPKIKIFGLIFFLILSITSFAKKVTIGNAIQLAKNLITEKTSLTLLDQSLSYSISNTSTFSKNSHDLAYLFNLSPTGFVIVSADDRCYPVIGYSFENDWEEDELPPALASWMNGYKEQILQAIHLGNQIKNIRNYPEIQSTWKYYLQKPFITRGKAEKNIDPLLTSTWNQGRYYNEMCPSDTNGHGGHAYTACVATWYGYKEPFWEAEYSISELGIDNHDQDQVINIYPNPAHQFISFGFELIGARSTGHGARIVVFDLFGREVEEIVVPPWQETGRMDVSGWNAGVYVAVLWDEYGIVGREKFVVTKGWDKR